MTLAEQKKLLKEMVQNEMAPLLIGLRNEIKESNDKLEKIAKTGGAETKDLDVHITLKRLTELLDADRLKPKKGVDYFTVEEIKDIVRKATPVRGVDYLNPDEIENIKKSVKPKALKAGVDYFTDKDIDTFVATILKRATPVKGVHYNDGENGQDGKTLIKNKNYTAQELLEIISVLGIPVNMIIGLDKYVEKIASNTKPWQQGGFGGAGVQTQTVKFDIETPAGLINGSNTIYTTLNNITAILSLTINGQFIHPSKYSFSSNIVTLTSPLDSSLSGLPFTIVYV